MKKSQELHQLKYNGQSVLVLIEAVQDITLVAWPIVYGDDNPYDLDSRAVLSIFVDWAEEFEEMWWKLTDEEQEEKDYLLSIEAFAEKKAEEFVKAHE